ncbi:MAG: Hpt domain-containing protein [Maricaulaceae bacterium]
MATKSKDHPNVEIITPPNTLKVKVGGKIGPFQQDMIDKAEKAVNQLSGNFGAWLQEEIDKLELAFAEVQKQGLDGAVGRNFYIRSHDLKGLASTYEFPLITRIAASLCRLMRDGDGIASAPMGLIRAHVDTVRAAMRQGVRDDRHPIGKALAGELEAKVDEYLGETRDPNAQPAQL